MVKVFVTLTSLLFVASCTQNSKAKTQLYGEIDADEVDVASRIPARVKKLNVKIGQKVKAGDVLVEFEDDVIAAKRKQAAAVLAGAQSRKDIASDAVRPEEKEQLRAGVIAAKKQMEFAQSSLARSRAAFKEGAISQQALDEVEMKASGAAENYHAMEAKQRMAKNGARPEEKAGAQALYDQAQNAVAEAEAYSKDMNLVSPVDGEVFQILNHEGELVPAGYPVVTILKNTELWVTFQLPEQQLKDFPMGQTVALKVPALDNKVVSAQVSFISPMAGFANRTTTQDRGSFDLKTFELRASLPGASDPLLRPGMTALVSKAANAR